MTELLPFDYWRINTRGLDNRDCRRWSIRLRKFPVRIVSTVLNVQRAEPCIAQGLPLLEPLRNIEKDFFIFDCLQSRPPGNAAFVTGPIERLASCCSSNVIVVFSFRRVFNPFISYQRLICRRSFRIR